jgi:tRNA (cmo5U34)-methyltransferase
MTGDTTGSDNADPATDDSGDVPSLDQFFDALTDEYAAAIERCFPRYREMLWALLDYLPDDLEVNRILELGSGTGNLTVLLAERYPTAKIELVDVSSDSLDECRKRIGIDDRFRYRTQDFRSLDAADGSFDLVVSSIAIHHLTSDEKPKLFAELCRVLRPGGMFAYADQHAGVTSAIYQRHIAHWKAASLGAGSSEAEWQMWMKHQADHDHHDTMLAQIDWLREAGFEAIDCPWRYLLWTVLQARKPGGSKVAD